MTAPTLRAEFGSTARHAHERLITAYAGALTLPPDDMWSTFADHADPVALVCADDLVGFAAIDGEGELHRLHLESGHEHLGADFVQLIDGERPVRSMIAATTDPTALTVLLPLARSAMPVALLYQHESEPEGGRLDQLRAAMEEDQAAASAFVVAATGSPGEFAATYVAERIERRELYLHRQDHEIVGVGERRVDRLVPGHAHLGIIVGRSQRGRGLGGALMRTMVDRCRREQLTPLCSTEPDNAAAQRLIRQAGFRSRHSIFRLEVDTPDRP